MAKALANYLFPAEAVVRSRVVGGFNERVPGARF
jgi:hypothetical protein